MVRLQAEVHDEVAFMPVRIFGPGKPVLQGSANHICVRVSAERLEFYFQCPRHEDVVGIQKRYEIPARSANAQISRRTGAEIFSAFVRPKKDSIRILFDVSLSYLWTVVRRPIVYENYFPVIVSLA